MTNKMVVLVMQDAVVAIGYTGSAFVGARHTDDWIAQTTSPGADINGSGSAMMGLKTPSSLRFHQLCNRLRLGLAAAGIDKSTAIHIAGWRLKRRRLIPVSIVLRACSPLNIEPAARLRSIREPNATIFGHVGANMTSAEVAEGFKSIAGRPFNVETARDMLTNVIRAKAAIDRTVGSHVMSVILYHPAMRRIEGRFDPMHAHFGRQAVAGAQIQQVVGFSPWVLTPSSFVAPTETSGSGFGTWQADGWTIHVEDVLPETTPSNFHWSRRQPRASRP